MSGLDVTLDEIAETCRKALPLRPDAHAVLISALGASSEVIDLARRIVAATEKTPPGDPKPPPPPPPPPPTDVTIPGWLRDRILDAEDDARKVLEAAGHLAGRSRAISTALEELNRARGGDDAAFDRLSVVTDPLAMICRDIAAVVSGDGPWT